MILVLLGPKWMEAVSVFRWLTPTILIFALINPFSWVLFSLGLVGRSLKIALVIAPLVITAYIIGLPHGPNGVALAYSAAMTLWVLPHIAWCVKDTMFSVGDILKAAGRPFLSAVAAAMLAFSVQLLLWPLVASFPKASGGWGCTFSDHTQLMLLYVHAAESILSRPYPGIEKASSVRRDRTPGRSRMPSMIRRTSSLGRRL